MLWCLFHPVDDMRVVNAEEREKLLALGSWFEHPDDAKKMRKDYERQIQHGSKHRKSKITQEGRNDEK